mmetsp:Transcript_1238/g.3593  ORF Transcript_1238/g.3593 Transcript_1238/m.3593 type:complete len:89 (+) Transcript_1238:2027-2293(+)
MPRTASSSYKKAVARVSEAPFTSDQRLGGRTILMAISPRAPLLHSLRTLLGLWSEEAKAHLHSSSNLLEFIKICAEAKVQLPEMEEAV